MSKMVMGVFAASVLTFAACKSEERRDTTAPPPAAREVPSEPAAREVPSEPARPAEPEVRLGEGERLWGEDGDKDNVTAWTPAAAKKPVKLYVVRTGENKGVLRSEHDGRVRDIETFTLGKDGANARVRRLSDERALLTYTPWADGGEKNARVGVLLGWDEQDGRVRVLKRWRGSLTQKDPAWFASGDTTASDETLAACERVVKRISACSKQGPFREALFRRGDKSERAAAEKDFTTQVRRWGKGSGAREQCRSWAGTDYEDTHLSDAGELETLERDTKLSCELFGRELDDEGGLPHRRVRNEAAN